MHSPWLYRGQELTCQSRGHGFDPWSGKITYVVQPLSQCVTTKSLHSNEDSARPKINKYIFSNYKYKCIRLFYLISLNGSLDIETKTTMELVVDSIWKTKMRENTPQYSGEEKLNFVIPREEK